MNTARRGNHSNLAPNQFTCQWRQLIKLILGPAVFDCDILALTKAAVLKPLTKCAEQMRVRGGRCTVKKSDHRHRLLLRPRRERPRTRRAAEQPDERAALHSITSSARCCRNQGTSSPSALAVLRFITSSNFVGCSTGISAGFPPCKILTTNAAARRNESGPSAP